MTPGVNTRINSLDIRPLFFPTESRERKTVVTAVVSGASRDAGNSPTTAVRGGMLMGKVTASGKLVPLDLALSNGGQTFHSVLMGDWKAIDDNGADRDERLSVCVSADIIPSQLLYKGLALVGHASEAAIRTAMRAKFFIFDDE